MRGEKPGILPMAIAAVVALSMLSSPPAAAQERIPVDFGSETLFLTNGADPGLGMAWVLPGFDDSAWSVGEFGLGYQAGSGAEELIRTDMGPGTYSVYSRTTFQIEDPAEIGNLFVGADYDDGVVVWINGVEVYRSSEMPAGPIAWNSVAQTREPSNAILPVFDPLIDISAAIPQLVVGENVLAVGVWNDSPTSSDLLLVPRLVTNFAVDLLRRPYIQDLRPTSATIRWRTASAESSRVVFGTSLSDPKQRRNFILKTEHALTLNDLQPGATYYYAVGSNPRLLVGGEAGYTFTTPPIPGTRKPMRIWVVGDVGTGQVTATRNRDRYYKDWSDKPTDVLMLLGDNAYPDGTDEDYQSRFFDVFSEILQRAPTWSALGNHDGGGDYFNIFSFPTDGGAGGVASGSEAYYSFDYGNVHFIVLDSFESDRTPGSAMLTWLAADLATVTADWTIGIWHHPAYSKGSHNSDTEIELIEMRTHVVPLLEAHGVDLVFSGHSHDYERTFLIDGHYGSSTTYGQIHELDGGDGSRLGDGAYTKPSVGPAPHQGTVYTVTGSAGAAAAVGALDHPAMAIALDMAGTVVVDIDGLFLDVSFVNPGGEIVDTFRITKGQVPGPPVAAFSAGPLSGSAPLQVAFTDQAAGNPDEWNWDFDNDGTAESTEQSPVHQFLTPGLYSVRQIVGNIVAFDETVEEALICVTAGAPPVVSGLRHAVDFYGFFWPAAPGPVTYDIVRGDLGLLRSLQGFAGSNPICAVDGLAATNLLDPDEPAPNEGFYYLGRVSDCAGAIGSLDSGEPSQPVSRDPALVATCP